MFSIKKEILKHNLCYIENRLVIQSYKICCTFNYTLKSRMKSALFFRDSKNGICKTTLINMLSLTSIFLVNEIYQSNYQKIIRSAIFIVFGKAVLYRKC